MPLTDVLPHNSHCQGWYEDWRVASGDLQGPRAKVRVVNFLFCDNQITLPPSRSVLGGHVHVYGDIIRYAVIYLGGMYMQVTQ